MSHLKQEVFDHLMFKIYFLHPGVEKTEKWKKNYGPFTYITRKGADLDEITVGTELFSDVRVNDYKEGSFRNCLAF